MGFGEEVHRGLRLVPEAENLEKAGPGGTLHIRPQPVGCFWGERGQRVTVGLGFSEVLERRRTEHFPGKGSWENRHLLDEREVSGGNEPSEKYKEDRPSQRGRESL